MKIKTTIALLGAIALSPAAAVAERGADVYNQTCVACHGDDGSGALPGVPDFGAKAGVLSQTDAVLIDHILNGFQAPGSPMAMPAKGGNPNLTEEDVRAVLRYIRTRFGAS